MFKNPFSFEGRIRRTEYGISFIIYVIIAVIVNAIMQDGSAAIIGLAYIPMLWFCWAQGAKRCHDRGNNGWYQIIPFYALWMLFAEGESGINEYGLNPKETYTDESLNDTEPRINDTENSNTNYQNTEKESTNNQFVPDEKVNTQTIENEATNKIFVPKKKPIRKSQS